jgi:hypothetical protein
VGLGGGDRKLAAAAVDDDRVRPFPSGGTLLRFQHSDLPSFEAAESHGHGWDHYFARLAVVAADGDLGSDFWTDGPMQ